MDFASNSTAGALSGKRSGITPGNGGAFDDWTMSPLPFRVRPQQLPRFRLVSSHFRPYMSLQRLMGPGLLTLAAD
jgi:hypothetical protein